MNKTFSPLLSQLLSLSAIASLMIFSPRVINAQPISDEQIVTYARAVIAIESHRQRAYAEIQRIMGAEPPEIMCNQPDSYNNLPEDAQRVAIAYCETSEATVTDMGMTVKEFNEITQQVKEDPDLERSVQEVILDLQK